MTADHAKPLSSILEGVEVAGSRGDLGTSVSALAYDSRRVHEGCLFVALKGTEQDGNRFVPQALKRGAVGVVSEADAPAGLAVPWVKVAFARRALSQMAANLYDHPAHGVKLIGVTGTNGKTTTTYMLHSILTQAGKRAGLFGTVKHRTVTGEVDAINTTPESLDLQGFLAEWRDAGAEWTVMEVSSHGLDFERVYGVPFAAAVFTNLAMDHLNYHGTMEAYFEAKRQLFLGQGAPPPGISAVNIDDEYGRRLVPDCEGRSILYSLTDAGAQVRSEEVRFGSDGTVFHLVTPQGTTEVSAHMVGRSNLYNMVAAAAAAHGLGFSLQEICAGLEGLERVPGRFERIDAGQPFAVIVDFAHTDLAFTNLLETAREMTEGRVIIIFGSGGDRDRSKRPVMGEIAGKLADFIILTTDNPRTEDPEQILRDIRKGLDPTGADYWIVEDREEAFERAFRNARPGDTVLLAGKGHQASQVYSDHERPWNEIEIAVRALKACGYGEGR